MILDSEVSMVLGKIDEIERANDLHSDGKSLSTAAKLIFTAGLQKKEISALKIKDVLSENGIFDQVTMDAVYQFQLAKIPSL